MAKEKGRNRIHVNKPGDLELTERYDEMQWVSRINRAIEENRITLFAQQIVPAQSPLDGIFFEIFAYLRNETGETIQPHIYLPAAERYGLTPNIDRWVIKNTFSAISQWRGNKLHTCAINLSGHSFCDDDFLNYIINLFDLFDISPELICFEITETAAISNLKCAVRFISVLSDMGVRFALDDFGSGLSSFGYLKNLQVDYLKIDGAFIVDMENNSADHAMVTAINKIGHTMGMKTIAEFVETQQIFSAIKDLGIDFGQGFGINKPLPLSYYSKEKQNNNNSLEDIA